MPSLRVMFCTHVLSGQVPLPESMHPAYSETHFASAEPVTDWPDEFAIITAYASTGERWTAEQNAAADAALAVALRKESGWLQRVTGYSPTTLHAEPGWAVALPFESACDIGSHFKQDAIYIVRNGTLFVSHCDHRRQLVELGPFLPRLHHSPQVPVVGEQG